jgi:hypothetical protein
MAIVDHFNLIHCDMVKEQLSAVIMIQPVIDVYVTRLLSATG